MRDGKQGAHMQQANLSYTSCCCPCASVAIVQDFAGGHVKGAINMEAEHFAGDAAVDQLIDTALAGKTRVVLHCMLSQQRGPRCAARLAQRLQERGLQQPAVLVMSGGWQRFSRMYGDDPDLVQHE
jgi:Cdc25 family phosphatase